MPFLLVGMPFLRDGIPQWVWPYALDLFCHFGRRPGELAAHGRRDVDHLDAPAVQADSIQQLPHVFDSPSGVEITFQVMTVALQSASYHHSVGTILEGAQDIQHVEFAGAG